MKFLDILRARLAELHTLRSEKLAELESVTAAAESESRAKLNDDESARYNAVKDDIDLIDIDLDPAWEGTTAYRAAELDQIETRAKAASIVPTAPVPGAKEPIDTALDRSATRSQLADSVTRSLEDRVDADGMAHVRSVVRQHLSDQLGEEFVSDETRAWARGLIGRTTPAYQRGFLKYIAGGQAMWDTDERTAMAVGTNTQGGFLVPTHLDPTIILTNDGSSNMIRGISRVETLVDGNVWNGVTSAGSTFSWDAELTEVSDDSPSVGRSSIPVYKAQGFIQMSLEALQDVPSLQAGLGTIIADARDRLEGAAHATGSGSAQPTGIFTALDANTNVELTSTTAATIGLVDLQAVYRSVGVRWRGRSSWLIHPLFLGSVQALGTALSASYSTDLTEAYTARILGRPVVESDDAPSTTTTTVLDNVLVLGDFQNFVVVDKPGSTSIEFIPHLFNTSNNLPDGRRGLYVHWRSGSDSVNDVAFSLLQDKTSA